MAEDALMRFLVHIGEQCQLDEEILSYAHGVLEGLCEDDAEPEEALSGLHDLFEGASPAFKSLAPDQRVQALHWLWVQAEADMAAQRSEPAEQPQPPPDNHAERDADCSRVDGSASGCPKAATTSTGNAKPTASVTPTAKAAAPSDKEGVGMLRPLVPGHISDEFLAAFLERYKGDVPAAAQELVDLGEGGGMAQAQAVWQEHQQESERRASEQARLDERTKHSIVAKYDLMPVARANPKRERQAWQPAAERHAAPKQAVRYRDGQTIHTSQKYIVERVGEEWNGGSSGKVYTKGKRGKGFV